MKICRIVTLPVDIINLLYGFEDIHGQTFGPERYDNPTLLGGGGGDSIFNPADSLPLKLVQLPLLRRNFHELFQGGSVGEYFKFI